MSKDADTTTGTIPFTSADRVLGVVVGFDGSDNSALALTYAARISQRRGSLLTVVTSVTMPAGFYTTLATIPPNLADMEEQAIKEILDQARELLKDYPGEVSYVGETGDAAGVLISKSEAAELVVVGARAHAHCPTVIVPRDYADGDLVVLG